MPSVNQTKICITALNKAINVPFIVVGGAGGLLKGSTRETSDVDILVSKAHSINDIQRTLTATVEFTMPKGLVQFQSLADEVTIPIDILTTLVDKITYEDLENHTTVVDGVHVMTDEFSSL